MTGSESTQGLTLPKRIVVDASHTIGSGLNTGVQRVVRSICSQLPQLADVETKVVINHRQRFYEVDFESLGEVYAHLNAWRANVVEHLPPVYQRVCEGVCRTLPFAPVKKALLPQPGRQGLYRLPLRMVGKRILANQRLNPVLVGEDDLLLLPDAYWAHPQVWTAAGEARARGAYVASIIYDLIPMEFPELVAPGADHSFCQYLEQAISHSDALIAISKSVQSQLDRYLRRTQTELEVSCQTSSFELGAEFSIPEGSVRPHVVDVFDTSQSAPYLMVASFDPRKNHHYLLDAFEEIWKLAPELRLCLVGRVGGMCQDVLERISQHRRREKIITLHDLTDRELSHCYQHARAVVFPSLAEGFGLPIVEAQWYGRQVFASDIPVHREVGKANCTYCDLSSPKDLAAKILSWEAGYSPEAATPRVAGPLSWEASVKQLLGECFRMMQAKAHYPGSMRQAS